MTCRSVLWGAVVPLHERFALHPVPQHKLAQPFRKISMLASLCSAQAASGAVARVALTLAFGLASTAFAQCPNPFVAWGKNNEGQCNVPKALGRVESMAAGDTWSVAFARGRFATEGATPRGGPQWVQPPQDATLGGGVPTLSVGDRFTVALNAQNGRIACWGENNDGQCNIPADIGKVKRIAARHDHTIAVHDFPTPFADGNFFESTCPSVRSDLHADGFIDATDLSTLFAPWGLTDTEIGDLSDNGIVDGDDLTQLLSNQDASET